MPSINISNIFQKLISKSYDNFSNDVGKSLIVLGAVGWVLSSLAQITMLVTNKNIDKKEKKFLIPQEIADGAVNVGLYFGITQALKSYVDKKFETGQWFLKDTKDVVASTKQIITPFDTHMKGIFEELKKVDSTLAKKQGKFTSTFFEKGLEELNKISIKGKAIDIPTDNVIFTEKICKIRNQEQLDALIETFTKSQSKYFGYKNGIGVIAALTGSIIACNILTPIARNAVGNMFQKKSLNKKHPVKKENVQPVKKMQVSTTSYSPISSAYNMFKI